MGKFYKECTNLKLKHRQQAYALNTESEKQWMIGEGVSEETEGQGKCTRQFVLIAEMNVKFHLSLQKTGLFIAGTVFRNIDRQEEIDISLISRS